jgi:hypothetical protein
MYVQCNSVTRLRNRFVVEPEQWTLCVAVVVNLHVTVKYVTILNVTQQSFYGKFVTDNNANYK